MFTIHSSGLWAEVFGSRRPGIHTLDMYPEAWEQRSIALLRALPGDCRDRHIIVALLTLPLAEADALHVQEQHVAASLLKKVKRDSGVCVCVQHMLKWPVKEREIAQTLHDGNFYLSLPACMYSLHFGAQSQSVTPNYTSQACFRSTSCASATATFKRCLDPKSRLLSEWFPPISVNTCRWLSPQGECARP
jgi:hypothetical protein